MGKIDTQIIKGNNREEGSITLLDENGNEIGYVDFFIEKRRAHVNSKETSEIKIVDKRPESNTLFEINNKNFYGILENYRIFFESINWGTTFADYPQLGKELKKYI